MSKLDDYLEYKRAFLELLEDEKKIDNNCEEALADLSDSLDYFSFQERILRKRIINLRKQKHEIQKKYFMIKGQFDDKKRDIEREFNHEYGNQFVSVSIGEIKEELSLLMGVSLNDIDVNLCFGDSIFSFEDSDNVHETLENYLEYFNSSHRIQYNDNSLFSISVNFDYENQSFTIVSLNSLSDIDDSGKSLLDHCSSLKCDSNHLGSKLVIDKDLDDIIINVSFKDLANDFEQFNVDDEVSDTLKKVFLNILKKQNSKGNKRINLKK